MAEKTYMFIADDAESAPENESNTASVKTTLFESDYCTPVIDIFGKAMLDMRSTDGIREFVTGSGKYYLYSVEVDNQVNKSFSAAFVER